MRFGRFLFFLIGFQWSTFLIFADDPAPQWRVIETKYPTLDVVIAPYSVLDFGADASGLKDMTAIFQHALDAIAVSQRP